MLEAGPGPLFFVMATEAYPACARKEGLAFTQTIYWAFNIMITFGFRPVSELLGSALTFWGLAGINVIMVLLVIVFLDESRPVDGALRSPAGKLLTHYVAE